MPRWRRLVWFSTLASLAAGSLWATAATEVFPLPSGGVERALPRGAVHVYLIDLRADEYIHLKAEQLGVDVELRLLDPAGELLLRIDSPNGERGPEDLFYVALHPGRYLVELSAFSGRAGRYRLSLATRRPATRRDREEAAALAAFCRGRSLDDQSATEEAAAAYRQAVDLCRECGEGPLRLEAQRRLANLLVQKKHAPEEALPIYREILAAHQRSGDQRGQALMQTEIARCLLDLNDLGPAQTAGREALAAWRKIGDSDGVANALHSLGEASRRQGNLQVALSFYEEELEKAGKPEDRARALTALGVVLGTAGDTAGAVGSFDRALAQLHGTGDINVRVAALTQLGNALFDADMLYQARSVLIKAWLLLLKSGEVSPHERAVALVSLGRVYLKLGDRRRAEKFHRRALQLFAVAGSRAEEAAVWSNLGWIAEAQGNFQVALEVFQRVLPQARGGHLPDLEVAILLGMARAELRRANPIASRARLEEALEIIEEVRGGIIRPDLQVAFFAKREDWYGVTIDLLMQEHHRQATSDGDLRAFAVSERSRARTLLDKIAGSGAGANLLSVPEVRRALEDDTLLLEYYLSEPKSYLWVVSSSSAASFELPGRTKIERRARNVLSILSRRGASPILVKARLNELGESLLGRVRGLLGTKRLVIIPHGVLQTIPFAVLSDPDRGTPGWSPLLLRHETLVISSASVLEALRRRGEARKGNAEDLALIGDAVISVEDPRLPPAAQSMAGPLDGGPLSQLPFVKQEAEAILKLVPPGKVLKLTGFDANREEVTSGRLDPYGILHFATHGLFDEEHPDRSALVLSRFDSAGRLRRGLLYAQDIEKMRLHARLVVLSACETARGRAIRGEGVVGLTRSFLAAGAGGVLVSLWKVDDRATAVLMERFYQSLLKKGRTPAAALREAQLSMWNEERWSRPYQWAGFLLQGSGD